MSIDEQRAPQATFPGENSCVFELLDLAHEYYNAAMALFERADGATSLSYAPARLCGIHAIELYLNAYLRHCGVSPKEVRSRMHNLADPIFVTELNLKHRTAKHLETMTENREYLIARYAPDLTAQHSELNRLTATLVEVMMKVGKAVQNSKKGTDQ